MNNVIPIRIKECRKNKKISQEKLAEIIGVSVITIKRWENVKDKRLPPADIMLEIAKILDTPINYLMGESNNNNKEMDVNSNVCDNVENMLTYNDGEQVICLKNTPENKILFHNFILQIHNMIVNNSKKLNSKGFNNANTPYLDIKQQDVGRDAIVNLPSTIKNIENINN